MICASCFVFINFIGIVATSLNSWNYDNKSTALLIPFDSSRSNTSEYGAYKLTYFYSIFLDNKLRYCNIQNINCIIGNYNTNKKKHSLRFLKIFWIIRLLKIGYSYIIVTDFDTLFLFPYYFPNISNTFPKGKYLALANDFVSYAKFSTGVMFIKRHNITISLFKKFRKFFLQLYSFNKKNNNKINSYFIYNNIKISSNHVKNIYNSDQLCLHNILLFQPHWLEYIHIINLTKYNAFPIMSYPWNVMKLKQGDQNNQTFILHFAGIEIYILTINMMIYNIYYAYIYIL